MYKAGDFTNGKMNEIFKKASICNPAKTSSKNVVGVNIEHKQFGLLSLIHQEIFAVKSLIVYSSLTGANMEEEFMVDGVEMSDDQQKEKVNKFLSGFKVEYKHEWVDIFFVLVSMISVKYKGEENV